MTNQPHAPDASLTRLEVVRRDDESPSAYLERYLRLRATHAPSDATDAGWVYRNVEDLVWQLGTAWTAAPLPAFVRLGFDGLCYSNTLELIREARRYDLELDYVEGLAIHPDSGQPWLHAWAVDSQGRAWDRTWSRPELGAYFGILFHWPEVERFDALGPDHLGIIAQQHLLGWPLFRHGVLFPMDAPQAAPRRPREACHG